jgi:beta-phosphoglucomutase
MIRGVLFDMDGVLADSEEYILQASILMFAELGFTIDPDDFLPFVGTGEGNAIDKVAEKNGIRVDIEQVKARTYEIYGTIIHNNLKPLPGAVEVVSRCRKAGLRLAIATSSDKVKIDASLAETGIHSSWFDAIITGLDVENKKPFPDIYLKAAEKIGLRPEECLVVEDAVSGITAARRAGCRCLAVSSSFDRKLLLEADWICNSLDQIPEEALTW